MPWLQVYLSAWTLKFLTRFDMNQTETFWRTFLNTTISNLSPLKKCNTKKLHFFQLKFAWHFRPFSQSHRHSVPLISLVSLDLHSYCLCWQDFLYMLAYLDRRFWDHNMALQHDFNYSIKLAFLSFFAVRNWLLIY